jgi:hypothetical protein
MVPMLLNVPYFKDILIHPGNSPNDTEGCLLPGYKASFKTVEESSNAFRDLLSKIYSKLEKEEVFISIKGGFDSSEWEMEKET